jgi:hypothetical protein
MTYSFTQTETKTFTVTNAKYLASKVAADLRRMMRLYPESELSETSITSFETELTEVLRKGFLGSVAYGFKKDGKWIEPTLKYTASQLENDNYSDDDPGRIVPGANTTGAAFYSYLTNNGAWSKLTAEEREAFNKTLPFQRTGAPEPEINGYLTSDKSYASGGKSLERSTVKSFK